MGSSRDGDGKGESDARDETKECRRFDVKDVNEMKRMRKTK